MHRTLAFALALLLCTTALPIVDAQRVERVHYLPGTIVIGISCSGERHDWVPTYTPDAEDLQNNAVDWALSGEPECAPNDVRNEAQGTNDPGGYGAAAFALLPDDVSVHVTTYDEVFGPHDSWLKVTTPESESTGQPETSEGCGPQFIILPTDMYDHWGRPLLVWAFVHEAGVEEDLSRVCFATTGWAEAALG